MKTASHKSGSSSKSLAEFIAQTKKDSIQAMEDQRGQSINQANIQDLIHSSPKQLQLQRYAKMANTSQKGATWANAAIQAKLEIGAANDPLEKEADEMADALIQNEEEETSVQKKSNLAISKCDCDKEEQAVQCQGKKEPGNTSDQWQQQLNANRGKGSPLPKDFRRQVEAQFGVDFSNIRIHTGQKAQQMCTAMNALAFTYGSDIYFNTGQYDPQSREGKKLLIHELTHTIQQGAVGEKASGSEEKIQRKEYGAEIQDKLREANSKLITEAPIPHAAPHSQGINNFNNLGRADLYQSSDNSIFGVKGRSEKNTDEYSDATKIRIYNKLRPSKTEPPKGHSGSNPNITENASFEIDKKGNSKHLSGPKKLKGDFPASVKIGELKGINTKHDEPSTGPWQVKKYQEGINKFHEKANGDFENNFTKPSVGDLTSLNIPKGLNYANFDKEKNKLGAGNILIQGGSWRLWLGQVGKTGIYLHDFLPHGRELLDIEKQNSNGKSRKVLDKEMKAVLDIIGNTSQKKIQKKPKPRPAKKEKTERPTVMTKANKKKIQKKKSNKKNPKWAEAQDKFLQHQTTLVKLYAEYKNTGNAKILERILRFEKALKQSPKHSKKQSKLDQVLEKHQQLKFWASPIGQRAGLLRLQLGEKMDRMTDKAKPLNKKVKKLFKRTKKPKIPRLSGWKSKVIKMIMSGVMGSLQGQMKKNFSGIPDLVNGTVQKFEQMVSPDNMNEDIVGKLEKLSAKIDAINSNLDYYNRKIDKISKTIDHLESAKVMANIISSAILSIRVGVMVISCGSPPGWGCLWGLLAQLGISAAASIVVGTNWFDNNFVQPTTKKLLAKFDGLFPSPIKGIFNIWD